MTDRQPGPADSAERTAVPLRTTTGDLEAMSLYAGQGTERIHDIPLAGERLRGMVAEAAGLLARHASGRMTRGGRT